ncbi:MAG: AmmeMemoRadiSam system protein A [Candidatus Geothermincolia bacterium]
MSPVREPETEHARLARSVVEAYVKGEELPDTSAAPPGLEGRAGVFVCLKKEGELRGCIGTIRPVTASVAEEIKENAISSATRDFRFPPVTAEELDALAYSVDVLGEAEDIEDMSQLDPKTYGVIVRSGQKTGLLLPDLEGVDTAEEQVRISMMKAGIRPGEPVCLQRFKVTRHE